MNLTEIWSKITSAVVKWQEFLSLINGDQEDSSTTPPTYYPHEGYVVDGGIIPAGNSSIIVNVGENYDKDVYSLPSRCVSNISIFQNGDGGSVRFPWAMSDIPLPSNGSITIEPKHKITMSFDLLFNNMPTNGGGWMVEWTTINKTWQYLSQFAPGFWYTELGINPAPFRHNAIDYGTVAIGLQDIVTGDGELILLNQAADDYMYIRYPGTPTPSLTGNTRYLGVNDTWNALTYDHGRIVVVADGSANSSTINLRTEDFGTVGNLGGAHTWIKPAYGNNLWVTIGDTAAVSYSNDDGFTWTYNAAALPANTWSACIFGLGVFVAISRTAGASTAGSVSVDAVTWTPSVLSAAADWIDVACGNNLFLAVATGGEVSVSADMGATWIAGTALDPAYVWTQVIHIYGLFYAFNSTNSRVYYSRNGDNWYLTLFTTPGYANPRTLAMVF